MPTASTIGYLRIMHHIALALVVIVVGFASPASGQSNRTSYSAQLRQKIYAALDARDYDEAIVLLDRYLDEVPNDPFMLYNAACAYCRLEDYEQAVIYLDKAMRAGFQELDHMRSDPDLAALRRHPEYKKIFEALNRKDSNKVRSALAQWRNLYPSDEYRYETDKQRRIQYATALDDVAHLEMRQMLEAEADQLIESLFEAPPSYFVLIAVPRPEDARTYFKGNNSIGGIYQHSKRILVARNIGNSLRHEFFHAMHYGHMERLDQLHRLWIQEGLAALYEAYEISDDGSITFLPNQRHNITKSRARAGRLMRWSNLFELNQDRFMKRATSLYPQVRSIFRYVADQGKLVSWYKTYTETFREDPTGRMAFEVVFGKELREIERDWRRWVASQPKLDLVIRNGDASLGIRSGQNLTNDGVVITETLPYSAAKKAGLKKGDVIVSVDGKATRSLRELQAVISSRKVGDLVEVRIRRNEGYLNISVRLQPMRGGF